MKIKRFIAYLLDIMLVSVLLYVVSMFINIDINDINDKLNVLSSKLADKMITNKEYINSSAKLFQEISQREIIIMFINFVLIFGYFAVLPYFNKGQTLGKQILKIRITSENLTIFKLFIRNLIYNNLLYILLVLIFAYTIPSPYYYYIISFITMVQFVLVMLSIFMVLYRKDGRGLHDLVANTSVISVKEEEE